MNERWLLHPLLLTVLVSDQLLKALALLVLAPGESIQLLPGLQYALVETAVGVAAPERLRVLVIVLLAALVLLRIQQRGDQPRRFEGPAIPLLTAGLTSNLIDVVLLRQQVGLFVVDFPKLELLLSLADVAVAAGAVLVVVDVSKRARRVAPVSLPLFEAEPARVDMGQLRRGIDNVRVDVFLSPRFVESVRDLVAAILTPQIWWEPWRSAQPSPNPRDLDTVRRRYREVMDAATDYARRDGSSGLVPLAQLAAVKFIRDEIHGSFERLLREFRRDLDQDRQRGSRTLARLQQHLHSVRRRKAEIIEHASDLLLQQLEHVETEALQESRSAILGYANEVPSHWLENPMLRADDANSDVFLLTHYLLLGHRADDPTNPGRLEMLLREWLECEVNETGNGLGDMERSAEHSAAARHEPCAWFDDPRNAEVLLDAEATAQALSRMGNRAADAAQLRRRLAYQRMLLQRVERGLRSAGVLNTVLAAYQLSIVWPAVKLPVNPRVLLRYLADPVQRRRLAPKLFRNDRSDGSNAAREHLESAARRIEQMPSREREHYVYRFVRDFLRFRRDQKRMRLMRGWFDEIRLLSSQEDLRLARANRTLYELLTAEDEEQSQQQVVTGHVIVKADLRGSTAMTAQLAQRGLNPATHFSINFFEPIRSLIDLYGAQKVFVEGDAIILALLEQDGIGDGTSSACVARACGLARSIIEVVSAHNSTGMQYGLPNLELGIGIAYEKGAPTWLFDDDHPIMISSAIGRADRLSSCAAFLRKDAEASGGHRIQVYQAVGGRPVYDKEGVTTFRYNVNGIELEIGAFQKLEQEMHLHLLDMPAAQNPQPMERYYRGRYPDARGVMRNLVIREGRIRRYDRRQGPMSETTQSFYEVVVEPEVIGKVLESQAASGSRRER